MRGIQESYGGLIRNEGGIFFYFFIKGYILAQWKLNKYIIYRKISDQNQIFWYYIINNLRFSTFFILFLGFFQ